MYICSWIIRYVDIIFTALFWGFIMIKLVKPRPINILISCNFRLDLRLTVTTLYAAVSIMINTHHFELVLEPRLLDLPEN